MKPDGKMGGVIALGDLYESASGTNRYSETINL